MYFAQINAYVNQAVNKKPAEAGYTVLFHFLANNKDRH